MKHKLLLCATVLLASAAANAATPGFYVGAEAGSGKADSSNYKTFLDGELKGLTASSKTSDEGGFSGRLFAGYNFNEYFGIETGYARLTDNKYGYSVSNSAGYGYEYKFNRSAKFQTSAWDIVGKGYLPLKKFSSSLDKINVYGKLGIAYVTQNINSSLTGSAYYDGQQIASVAVENIDITNQSWQPVYGLGIAYDINRNLSADLSWTQIQGGGGDLRRADFNNFTSKANLIHLGIIYHFN